MSRWFVPCSGILAPILDCWIDRGVISTEYDRKLSIPTTPTRGSQSLAQAHGLATRELLSSSACPGGTFENSPGFQAWDQR